MARALKNIIIREVSSVDKGAGDGARVMLIKRDVPKNRTEKRADNVIDMTGLLGSKVNKDGAVNFDEAQANIESREAANDMIEEVNEAICAFSCSVQSILCDDDVADKNAAIQESFAQFKTHLAGLVPEGMEKAMTTAASPEVKKMVDDAVAAAIAKASTDNAAEIAKRDAEIAFLKMSPAEQEFAKAMSPEDKAKFAAKSKDDKAKDMEDAKKRLAEDPIAKADRQEREDLRKRVTELTEKDTKVEFGKRAVAIGLPEVQGEMLRKAYSGDAESITKVEALIKGLTEQVKTGKVFEEFGSSLQKTGATAYDELMLKAAELQKTDKNLTKEQAFDKVFNDPANVDLKKRHNDEEVAKRGRAA